MNETGSAREWARYIDEAPDGWHRARLCEFVAKLFAAGNDHDDVLAVVTVFNTKLAVQFKDRVLAEIVAGLKPEPEPISPLDPPW